MVEKGLTVAGKTLVEHLEATNHAQALDWITQQASRNPSDLTERDILKIHSIVLKGIDDTNAGYYRHVAVRIAGSRVVLPNPIKIPTLMKALIDFIKKSKLHPVALAAEAHYQLVTMHPFVDGNGRTARLLMNIILLMGGYPLTIIRKSDRLAYINALEKAQLDGSKEDYFTLIMKAVDRSLDIYLNAAKGKTDPQKETVTLLKIGQLAKQVGENNSTIRHWAKEGLLEVAEITASGYQLYASEMIQRIKKIQALKKKRHTLKEIKVQLEMKS